MCSLRLNILVAMTMTACAHWVQELPLFEKGSGENQGESWNGCVLKTCKAPKPSQKYCSVDDEKDTFHGNELAQDAVFASNLGSKSTAVAAYMRETNRQYRQDLKTVRANNGKGLLIGFPGNHPETIDPENAANYKVYQAKYQLGPTTATSGSINQCKAGKHLGEIRISVTRQQYFGTDGTAETKDDKDAVAVLRIKIENRCEDCGAPIDAGFYLRVEHGAPPTETVDPKTKAKSGGKCDGPMKDPKFENWATRFEFTSKKALSCGSVGNFDLMLTSLPDKGLKWPCDLKISLVSTCREELAFLYLTPPADKKQLVAPSWLGSFWR